MSNAKLKTTQTDASVQKFLDSVQDEEQQIDAKKIDTIMQEVTKEQPKMWGSSIIGYCDEHLKYESGRELDWFKVGFSPRKGKISLYLCNGGVEKFSDLLENFGKHKTGKGCIYINKLNDVDTDVLKKLIKRAIE